MYPLFRWASALHKHLINTILWMATPPHTHTFPYAPQVYVSKEKAATLSACGLAPRYASLLTTNHLEANIHAVRGQGSWVAG